jgi:radical SAM superfamily enzyme YgiQ (UPF0313 family)
MTVVGGPLATVEEDALEGLADVVFVGEADVTWPQFLRDWERGCHTNRYEQQEKSDVTHLPLPRIELLKTDRYMFGSMQISRGCPFTCEFCDIIVTLAPSARQPGSSRRARGISPGFRDHFIVDDNLTGNKKRSPILRDIVQWQQRAYPLTLFTRPRSDLLRTRNWCADGLPISKRICRH